MYTPSTNQSLPRPWLPAGRSVNQAAIGLPSPARAAVTVARALNAGPPGRLPARVASPSPAAAAAPPPSIATAKMQRIVLDQTLRRPRGNY